MFGKSCSAGCLSFLDPVLDQIRKVYHKYDGQSFEENREAYEAISAAINSNDLNRS